MYCRLFLIIGFGVRLILCTAFSLESFKIKYNLVRYHLLVKKVKYFYPALSLLELVRQVGECFTSCTYTGERCLCCANILQSITIVGHTFKRLMITKLIHTEIIYSLKCVLFMMIPILLFYDDMNAYYDHTNPYYDDTNAFKVDSFSK